MKTTTQTTIDRIAKVLCERYYLNERDAEDAAKTAFRIVTRAKKGK